ncbi:MAG: hypothetical protein ACPHQ9_14390 [Marinobacter sp.]|uniref:hypothetical protein n=1 Tax=Marinobacter sp. TaxID=50741 RepID=UPI003C43018D
MKVIGGNFGADGKAEVGSQNIIINGQMIGKSKISSMSANQHSQREFSLLTLLGGMFVLVPFFWLVTGFFLGSTAGFLAGLTTFIITLFACFDHVESRIVNIELEDGKAVSIQCKKKEAQRLMALAP